MLSSKNTAKIFIKEGIDFSEKRKDWLNEFCISLISRGGRKRIENSLKL